MESFVNALARAQEAARPAVRPLSAMVETAKLKVSERAISLSPEALKANRVVGFDSADPIARAYDVLRNTCEKDVKPRTPETPVFCTTSPTLGCGASTTAANLAFSLARLQRGHVVLADLATPEQGWRRLFGVNQADTDAQFQRDAVIPLDVAGVTLHAASLMPLVIGKSGAEIRDATRAWVASIQRELGPTFIVLDLPPLLSDDRVTSFISEVDMVVMVLATGKSTLAELETSKSYLHDAASVQLVLNKAREYDL